MTDDISKSQRDIEERLQEKWLQKRPHLPASNKAERRTGLRIEYHMYAYEIPDDRGRLDKYWRFERIEGSRSEIECDLNSQMIANKKLADLRKQGFTVHVLATPEHMTVEYQERQRKEFQNALEDSKSFLDVWSAVTGKPKP